MTINDLQKEVAKINQINGWHDSPRALSEMLVLIHSEVSEAVESDRNFEESLWYDQLKGGKPEGAVAELADVVIRVLDTMATAFPTIDFERVIMQKLDYNKTREYRHGNKKY